MPTPAAWIEPTKRRTSGDIGRYREIQGDVGRYDEEAHLLLLPEATTDLPYISLYLPRSPRTSSSSWKRRTASARASGAVSPGEG